MTVKCLCRGVVIAALNVALGIVPFTNADAQSRSRSARPEIKASLPSKGQTDAALAGIIAGLVGGTIVVVYVLTRKPTITGCVNSNADGMTITDEKDKRIYTMSGNTAGVKPGNRMKLQGKKEKPTGTGSVFVWETQKVSRDFGACQPQGIYDRPDLRSPQISKLTHYQA